MYRVWTASADDGESLARVLEAHLNEFAAEIISVCYNVTDEHRALAVYRSIDVYDEPLADAVVATAELIVDESQESGAWRRMARWRLPSPLPTAVRMISRYPDADRRPLPGRRLDPQPAADRIGALLHDLESEVSKGV